MKKVYYVLSAITDIFIRQGAILVVKEKVYNNRLNLIDLVKIYRKSNKIKSKK